MTGTGLQGLGGYHRLPRTFCRYPHSLSQPHLGLPSHTQPHPAGFSGLMLAHAPSLFLFGFGMPCLSIYVHMFTY